MPAIPVTHHKLYLPPVVRRFRHDGCQKLLLALRELDNATTLNAAGTPADLRLLLLADECHTQRGQFRYTTHGFMQVATLLGPGVGRFLPDLAGTRRRKIPEQLLNAKLAVEVFNKLVDLRFSVFSAYRVVRNTRTMTIDGLIGNTHQYLENASLFNLVTETLQQNRSSAAFYAGALIGRRLTMWWRETAPFLTCRVGGKNASLYRGYYFCNGESAGLSVKVAIVLFTPWGICLGPYKQYGARVRHQGRDFMLRIGTAMQRVLTLTLPQEEWQTTIPAALGQSLGFVLGQDFKARRARQRMLTVVLRHFGVDCSVASEVVRTTMELGRDVGREVEPTQQLDKLYAGRTGVDLLAALLYSARQLDITRRERLEQAAFHLLIDKFF